MEFFTFVAALMVRSGDRIYFGRLTYDRAITAMKRIGANMVGIPLEKDGVDIDALKRELKRTIPKIFYVIPDFQNPSGVTTSFGKRKEIMSLRRKSERESSVLPKPLNIAKDEFLVF
jgi:2-aminoadipate transaminase